MIAMKYRYLFPVSMDSQEIESALVLALVGAESLHGEIPVRLDGLHMFDKEHRACVIDAGTPVGRDLNRLFVGFVARQFGDDVLSVERVDGEPPLRRGRGARAVA